MLSLENIFDERFYLQRNRDVAIAVEQGLQASGLAHYVSLGQFEGRRPSAAFDPVFYLAANPDVAIAAGQGLTTAIAHFVGAGQLEGRDPIVDFSTRAYLATYPDVAAVAAAGGPDPLTAYQHYVAAGRSEGRTPAGLPLGTPPEVTHPLDPLTLEEIGRAIAVIRASQPPETTVLFPEVSLREPPKLEVLGHQAGVPFSRQAFVIVLDRAANTTHEAVVDLTTNTLRSLDLVPGAQPLITVEEFDILDTVVRNDPQWQAAIAARGLNPDDIQVDGWAPGLLSDTEQASGARLLRALSYVKGNDRNFYGRPVEGLLVTVNLNTETVDNIIDRGPVPISDANAGYDATAIALRQPLAPLNLTQPDGPEYGIDGQQITWDNWRFRWSMQPREGLTLHQVEFREGDTWLPVLYRANLSEMAVPYGDPDPTWTYRNAFDVGEYGIGRLSSSMELGREVPENATLLDAVFADDYGEAYDWPGSAAVYERPSGLLWQHYDYASGVTEARQGRELVLTSISTIGNYDYALDWVFHQDGILELEANLTGILLTKGTDAIAEPHDHSSHDHSHDHGSHDHGSPDPSGQTPSAISPYGTLVAPNLLAVNHQHFFNFRLDFDVAGQANIVKEMNVAPVPDRTTNPVGNAFVAPSRPLLTEMDAQRSLDWTQSRMWHIENPATTNGLGQPKSYGIMGGENSVPYPLPGSDTRESAGFTNHSLWVTPYDPSERYAAGEYPNQGPLGDGLPAWVADDEPVVNRDVVTWYTMGLTHVPRPEEWPIMTGHRMGFFLVPRGFSNENPTRAIAEPVLPAAGG